MAGLANNEIVKELTSSHAATMGGLLYAKTAPWGDPKQAFQDAISDPEFKQDAIDAALQAPTGSFDELLEEMELSEAEIRAFSTNFDPQIVAQIAQNNPGFESVMGPLAQQPAAQPTVQTPAAQAPQAPVSQNVQSPTPVVQQQPATAPQAPQPAVPQDPMVVGEQMIGNLHTSLGGNADATVDELLKDSDLVEAVGRDYMANGAEISQLMVKAQSGDPKAFDTLMSDHPEVVQTVVPIMASADPASTGTMALDSLHDKALSSIDGFDVATKGVSAKDMANLSSATTITDIENIPNIDMSSLDAEAQQDILDANSLMSDIKKGPSADLIGARLADPQQAAQILDNMKSLDSVGGAGGFDGMKIVMEDMKNNPNDVMSIIASQEMIGRATERWGAEMANVKIDTMFANFDEALQNMANGPMGNMLKNFGIDIDGIASSLGGFKNTLKELAGPMISGAGGTMASYQVAGGIIQGVNDNLDVMGVDETYFTGNTQDSMFANAMSALDKSKMLAEMSADAPEGWAARQSTALSARVIDGELHMVDPSTGKVTKHEIKPKPEPAPQVSQPAQGQQQPDLNQDSYGQQHNALDNNNRLPTPDPIVGI